MRWRGGSRNSSSVPDAEPKPEPDLDELLELFREPDEAPARKRIPGSVWLMLALVLSMAGVWLAVKTATGELAARSAALPMKPTKSKDRSAREEPAGKGSVVDDYLARCKKGMTAQEVRWIVEDFQKAGLDEAPGSLRAKIEATLKPFGSLHDSSQLPEHQIDAETLLVLREFGFKLALRQQDWYVDALADGLRLSPKQRGEAKERGRLFVSEKQGDFLEVEEASLVSNIGSPETGNFLRSRFLGGIRGIDLVFPNTGLLEPQFWLENEACAPWERVHLTDDQAEVTRRDEVLDASRENGNSEKGEKRLSWMDLKATQTDEEMDVEVSFPVEDIAAIFPYVKEQRFPEDDDLLALTKVMHPAQLKILLLLRPHTAEELEEALLKDSE